MGTSVRRQADGGRWWRLAAASLLLLSSASSSVSLAGEPVPGGTADGSPAGALIASHPQVLSMAVVRAGATPHDLAAAPSHFPTATAVPMSGGPPAGAHGAALPYQVAGARPLELRALPRDLAPPSLDDAAMRALGRLDGAKLALGGVGFGPRARDLHLRAEIRLDGGVPALGGWLHIDLASRHLSLPLPSVQVIPRPQGGLFGFEVRTILVERTF